MHDWDVPSRFAPGPGIIGSRTSKDSTRSVRGKWRFTLSGEVGGFGLGSDFTWHAFTKFTYQHSERFSWYVGYRAIAYDYEDSGQGFDYQRFDLLQHGPGAGIAFSF